MSGDGHDVDNRVHRTRLLSEAAAGDRVEGPKRRRWLTAIVILAFAALFAWDVVEAVGNLTALPQLYGFLGFTTEQVPWWLLIVDLLVSPIAFVVALIVARGRGTGRTALILLTALAVAAAWSIAITSIEPLVRPTLL